MPPCPVARSTSSRIRFLSSALNLRRCALARTSTSGELAAKGTAILASLTMVLLAALLCNYHRSKCLIDIGTEGSRSLPLDPHPPPAILLAGKGARKDVPPEVSDLAQPRLLQEQTPTLR